MKVSVVVRAHPARRGLVDDLLVALDRSAEVVWDRRGDDWDTGMRAWQAVDVGADVGLVIEDDAIVCRDLIAGLEQAMEAIPAEAVVSPYLGDRPERIARVARAATGASWVRMRSLIWGVAIAVPVATIDPMLAWCSAHHPGLPYDARIGRYYADVLGWPAYHTWPSLVDHRQVPSLLGHRDGRAAADFVGEDASALDADFNGGITQIR